MQIVDNKAMLLKLRNPARVTTVIPKSKQLGDDTVAVHWGIDEVQVLRNLNIKAPSPIEGKYQWTGKFAPFAHQKTTASFLTLNKRCFCFNEQGCVDSETEYLSPTGWVKISEYSGGKVAQYNPDTGTAEFVEPNEYVKLPCASMVRIKTKYGIDQLLSPEHRTLIVDGKSRKKQETLPAEVLLERHEAYHSGGKHKKSTKTIGFSSAAIPTTAYIQTTGLQADLDELRLMVAVIADGYFGSENTNHCTIRLKKEHKKTRLRELLKAADIPYKEVICKPEGFSKFTFYAPRKEKYFTEWYWGASQTELLNIVDEVQYWDSCITRGFRFSTVVKESADFIQYAASMTGHTARLHTNKREGKSTEYVVQIRKDTQHLFVRGSDRTITRATSTDGYKYCFMVDSTYLVFRRKGCVFMSGNTGKTASSIWASDFLLKQGKINRVLIICPLSIMDSAWRADLFTFAMHRSVEVCHGSPKKRKDILALNTDYVIINYDGIETVFDEIRDGGFDLIIVDEATHYKNPQTKRWKLLAKLIRAETWLWMMTGTPAAQSPVDAYGLAKMVNPYNVPRFFSAFRDQVMHKITQFKWVPKENATETVYQALQPAIRFTKDECLDLPEMTYVKRDVPLTPQQKKYYEVLKKQMVMEAAGEEITAANAAIVMSKLLQISCGAVYADEGDTVQFDIKNRYNVLKEAIDESSQKVLVFVPFKHTITMLADRLRKDGITTEVISGSVSASKRTEIFKSFQETPDPRVLVIQPQAAAHGVTLTAANTIVWWGPTSSLETYAQANARVHRSGQKHPCTVIQLQGSPVEKHVYSLLDNRINVHTKMIDLYKGLLD